MKAEDLLRAAKAEAIPEGWSGRWFVQKGEARVGIPIEKDGREVIIPPGLYTHLFCVTDSTLHQNPPGEVVMEDTPIELRTHLSFMMRARGRVLITGLGLGCVVRGLLANPAVDHITCIERSKDVLKLVGPYMPQTERLAIIEADAFEWVAKNKSLFDFAWHDLWTDRDAGEPHLDFWHTQLLFNCRETCKHQGAWKYSRKTRALLKRRGINLIA
jgi:hypothetical protein